MTTFYIFQEHIQHSAYMYILDVVGDVFVWA